MIKKNKKSNQQKKLSRKIEIECYYRNKTMYVYKLKT